MFETEQFLKVTNAESRRSLEVADRREVRLFTASQPAPEDTREVPVSAEGPAKLTPGPRIFLQTVPSSADPFLRRNTCVVLYCM